VAKATLMIRQAHQQFARSDSDPLAGGRDDAIISTSNFCNSAYKVDHLNSR